MTPKNSTYVLETLRFLFYTNGSPQERYRFRFGCLWVLIIVRPILQGYVLVVVKVFGLNNLVNVYK